MITAHVMGLPIEESVFQLMPAGAVMAAAAGIAVRTTFDRVRRIRRGVTRRSGERGRT
ncbi:MAG TPA: hypothetical protein VH760_08530 [Gaiellaceae bacterium]